MRKAKAYRNTIMQRFNVTHLAEVSPLRRVLAALAVLPLSAGRPWPGETSRHPMKRRIPASVCSRLALLRRGRRRKRRKQSDGRHRDRHGAGLENLLAHAGRGAIAPSFSGTNRSISRRPSAVARAGALRDGGGSSIGYKERVLLPVAITPQEEGRPGA